MAFLKTNDGVELFYNDWGSGKPVVLIHGWPLDADMWSAQAEFLARNGRRVITYDRRGFGRSGQPWEGYDYNTLASDLAAVLKTLDVEDATLVGFSMGGGEVARYVSTYGNARISRAMLVSSVTPYLLKTEDNPTGVDKSVFDKIIEGLHEDRPHFLAGFGKMFFGNGLLEHNVSAEMLQWSLQMAMMASYRATLECAKAFAMTDFRADLAAFHLPTLLIHGTADKTVPIEHSARVAVGLIQGAKLIEYEGAPHGLHVTAEALLNQDILDFSGG